jgi:hypothetical protein
MSVQIKPRFIRKESQMRVNFTVMNRLQEPFAEIDPASRVTWLQSTKNSRLARPKLSSFHHFGC